MWADRTLPTTARWGLVKPGWNHGGHGVAGFDRIRVAINVAFWEIGQHILCCSL